MKVVLHTSVISPHQLPLAEALVRKLGSDNFRYIYERELGTSGNSRAWTSTDIPSWCEAKSSPRAREWLVNSDVLLSGERCVDIFDERAAMGRRSLYMAERWFKPPLGMLRLLYPKYLKMARRFMALVRAGHITCLPIGWYAVQDFLRLEALAALRFPCGHFHPMKHVTPNAEPLMEVPGYPWMRLWGYFVAPSTDVIPTRAKDTSLRVLWVGRLLRWKRVDTLIRAVALVSSSMPISLTIIGEGPEKERLVELVRALKFNNGDGGCSKVQFMTSQPIAEIRRIMRQHDVYVLPSNGYEGWGAVVSEALEEGMIVLGSSDAGAAITLLPHDHLFKTGDFRALADLLGMAARGEVTASGIGAWSAESAADKFMSFCGL